MRTYRSGLFTRSKEGKQTHQAATLRTQTGEPSLEQGTIVQAPPSGPI
jgi:hypothetical protein